MDLTEETHNDRKPILKIAVGLCAVAVLGIFSITISLLPGSRLSAEQRLQRYAEDALAATSAEWAAVTMNGQKAALSGEAPDRTALNDAAFAVSLANWGRGPIFGAVTAVDVSGAGIAAATADAPPEPGADEASEAEAETVIAENDVPLSVPAAAPEAPYVVAAPDPRQLPVAAAASEPVATGDLPEQVEVYSPASAETALAAEPAPIDNAPTDNAAPPEDALADPAPNDTAAAEPQSPAPGDAPSAEPTISNVCQERLNAVFDDIEISFESAGVQIEPASEDPLRELATALLVCPRVRLEIVGHTDSSGDESSNRRLSRQRAQSVAAFLTGYGVAGDRLIVRGAGSSEPIAENDNDAGRAENRRIEFAVRSGNRP